MGSKGCERGHESMQIAFLEMRSVGTLARFVQTQSRQCLPFTEQLVAAQLIGGGGGERCAFVFTTKSKEITQIGAASLVIRVHFRTFVVLRVYSRN